MRVLQLGPFPPPNGGVQTNLRAIHDLLGRRGHHGAVIAITRSSRTEGTANVYKPRSIFALLKLLLTLKFDIVHLHIGGNLNFRLTMLMYLCGLLPHCRSVVTFHSGGYAAEAVRFARSFSLRGFAFRSIDFVIGVNSQMLEMFRRFGVKDEKMSLILPFVLKKPRPDSNVPDRLRLFTEKYRPLLLTVGLLENEYALSLQIDALDRVLGDFPNAGLLILGSGSLENELRGRIAAKSYSNNILLTGDVDHETTLHLIAKADVLLRPTYFDGDSVSVREALFLHTPVIATDNGMRPEGIHLIPAPPQIETLAEKIAEVLNNKIPQERSEQISGLENIEAVLSIYEMLIQKGNARKA